MTVTLVPVDDAIFWPRWVPQACDAALQAGKTFTHTKQMNKISKKSYTHKKITWLTNYHFKFIYWHLILYNSKVHLCVYNW